MNTSFCLIASLAGLFAIQPLVAEVQVTPREQCVHMGDSIGRAGMAAALVQPDGKERAILMLGGANFPQAMPGAKTPEERGPKVFYKDIRLWKMGQEGPQAVGALPYSLGYAASFQAADGMLIAGGCNETGHLDKATVVAVSLKGQVTTFMLPSLPVSTAYPAFAQQGNIFYVIGGQENENSTSCLNRVFALDLYATNKGWKELASMPDGRMLAGAAVLNGRIYVAGGCSLHPDAQGKPERTYLKSVLCYDIASDTWSYVQDMPETLVGAATPLPVVGGSLYVVGGDPGNYYRASLAGMAPAEHPGQNTAIYSFRPSKGEWRKEGMLSFGVATAPAVARDKTIYVISGETHPGVRAPEISTITIQENK